jgi:hypothetical protein
MDESINNEIELSKEERFYSSFNKIDNFFKEKDDYIKKYKHVSFEEVLKNAPKYYAFINFVEKINILLSKNKKWLKNFVEKNEIKFDFDLYERWKTGRNFDEKNFGYKNTECPSKWVHVLQDYFIDILEALQVLLVMEYYIKEDEYKKFLRDNPKVFFKLKANYTKSSSPSENIEKLFEIINFLLDLNKEYNFLTNPVIDTALCVKVYRKIDDSKIFELLKQKDFFIKYRLEFLKKTANFNRQKLPYENDVIDVAAKYSNSFSELFFTFNEYKKRLIEKQNSVKK